MAEILLAGVVVAALLTDRYLDEVSELACLDNPESYAGESLVLSVGPPKPDRSKDRGQTRYDPPPTCRFSIGPTTLSCKKCYCYRNSKLP